MVDLIVPDKSKHKYVVGIDFGHGETSAAICEIEWDKAAAQRDSYVMDIDIDRAARKKVIPSAICRIGKNKYKGEEAFEHITDNNGIRISFKERPQSLYGENETLMREFMEAVYTAICDNDDRLEPGNHIVYIARPSGWTDEGSKELYREMALRAGIPLAGLTSESRAAIFFAKTTQNFAKEIDHGAIVFDLGSSTLDFTYLSEDDSPIDFGYDLGASLIDEALYKCLIQKSDAVSNFIANYPGYHDALLFQVRKFKEEAYSRNPESKTIGGFTLARILSEKEASYDDYAGIYVDLRVKNLQELNEMVEATIRYQQKIRDAIEHFKREYIKGRPINGVFLTGGASRMNFLRPLIADALGLPLEKVKIDKDNPSLTISRGIALLGTMDAITNLNIKEIRSQVSTILDNNIYIGDLIEKMVGNLTGEAWNVVVGTCSRWVSNGTTTGESELKTWLNNDLKSFQNQKIRPIIEQTLKGYFVSEIEKIRKRVNQIINRYAPGHEIDSSYAMTIDNNLSSFNGGIENMKTTIAQVCGNIQYPIALLFVGLLDYFLFNVFFSLFVWFRVAVNYITGGDSGIRQGKANQLLEKRDQILGKIRSQMKVELSANSGFNYSVRTAIIDFFNKLVDRNIQKAIIPIE